MENKACGVDRGVSPDDVYNADETGLFYKCLPDKTISFKRDDCHVSKHSNKRALFTVFKQYGNS